MMGPTAISTPIEYRYRYRHGPQVKRGGASRCELLHLYNQCRSQPPNRAPGACNRMSRFRTVSSREPRRNIGDSAREEGGPLISVIIPVYRLSRLVTHSVKAVEIVLKSSGYSYEIVVVDDGSPDNTYQHALRAARNLLCMCEDVMLRSVGKDKPSLVTMPKSSSTR